MRHTAALAVAALFATQVLAAPEIRTDRLLEHIKFLASDDLKGRDTGSEGLQRAAEYIATEFKTAGLQPGWHGQWLQPFDVNIGLSIGSGNTLSLHSGSVDVALTIGTRRAQAATHIHPRKDAPHVVHTANRPP